VRLTPQMRRLVRLGALTKCALRPWSSVHSKLPIEELKRSNKTCVVPDKPASFIALRVVPVPYETVSTETYNQMLGYQEMANILNRAYELVLEDYTSGKPVASADMGESKHAYYKRAVDELKPKPQAGELTVPAEQVPPPDGSIDMAALKAAGNEGEADAANA
jgi:hypothetical protein